MRVNIQLLSKLEKNFSSVTIKTFLTDEQPVNNSAPQKVFLIRT